MFNKRGHHISGSGSAGGAEGQFITLYGTQPYESVDFGVSWQAGTTLACYASAMSGTGQYVLRSSYGNYFETSSDYGATWIQFPIAQNWWGAGMSEDGKYQLIVGRATGDIHVSSDYGVTFTPKGYSANFYGAGVSASGQYMIVTSRGEIYVSTNYGATWGTIAQLSGNNIYGVCVSGNGQYMYGVGASLPIFRSTNYGANGSWSTTAAAKTRYEIAASHTGEYVMTAGYGSFIDLSFNYGASFGLSTYTGNFYTAGMTGSGNKMIMGVNATNAYISDDFGNTFTSQTITTGAIKSISINKGLYL